MVTGRVDVPPECSDLVAIRNSELPQERRSRTLPLEASVPLSLVAPLADDHGDLLEGTSLPRPRRQAMARRECRALFTRHRLETRPCILQELHGSPLLPLTNEATALSLLVAPQGVELEEDAVLLDDGANVACVNAVEDPVYVRLRGLEVPVHAEGDKGVSSHLPLLVAVKGVEELSGGAKFLPDPSHEVVHLLTFFGRNLTQG
mmetsp:Transcript_7989/g.18554  ORF Transcript_7989/g.18554 Transcript_7989/m.18554 type:complete len:204 (-) Transcript_7989:478-1089(-)